MTQRARDLILFGAIAVLAIFAAWGWMRTPPQTQAAGNCGQAEPPTYDQSAAPQGQPVTGTYTYANPAGQQSNELPAYASRGYVRTVRPAPPPEAAQQPNAEPAQDSAPPTYAPPPPSAQHFVERGGGAPVHRYTDGRARSRR